MIQLDVQALLAGQILQVSKYGSSRNAKWQCEDNYLVGYSTAAITNSVGKKYDGKFACIVWKPDSKKNPQRWEIVYFRAFTQRKLAKKYALKFYYQHSPKTAVRHGYIKGD